MTTHLKYCIFPNTTHYYQHMDPEEDCGICHVFCCCSMIDCITCGNCCGCCSGYDQTRSRHGYSFEPTIENNVCGHYWESYFPNSFSEIKEINILNLCCCTIKSCSSCYIMMIKCCFCSDCR